MNYGDMSKEKLLIEIKKLEIENENLKSAYQTDIASRENIENKLKHEQQFSKSLIDSLPGIFYLYTYPELKLVMYNRNHETLLGYSEGEIMGRYIYDWHVPEAKEIAREAIELVMEKGLNVLESPLLNKQGIYIPFLMTGTRFESQDNLYLMGVGIDITERVQAEKALRDSEAMLSKIINNVPQSIFWKDTNSRYLGCNSVFAKAAGFDNHNDIIGKTDYDLPWTKEESTAYIADDREVIQNNAPKMHIIETLQQADGSNLWIDTSKIPLVDSEGTTFGLLGVYSDITERKRVQEALLASELRFRTVLENLVNVAVQAYKPDGTITFWNKTSEEYYGYTQEEMLNQNILEIFFQNDAQREHERQEMQRILETRVMPKPEEITMINKFGKTISFIANRMLIQRSNNDLEFFCFDIDITERKKAEAEVIKLNEELENRVIERTAELQQTLDKLQESNIELKMLNEEVVDNTKKILLLNDELITSQQKLKEAIASKDRFFSIIAHDLRNPFVVLLNNSELLEKYYQQMNDAEKMRIILLIKNASANTYSLLENLLQWASTQLGIIEYSPFEINLHDLVLKMIMILKPLAEQKQLSLNMNIPDDTIVYCDAEMIKTIINNLITNSIKFTKQGGDILVGLLVDHQKNEYIVYIRDNGIGMSPEIMDGLFQIDKKVSRKGTEGEPSTGLGLLICKEFIERHSGTIWAESKPQTGSTFFFTLPIHSYFG